MRGGQSHAETAVELDAFDAQRQQPDAVDLAHLVGADQLAVGDQLGQHHGDGLQRFGFFVVVLAARAVLDGQDAHHPAGMQDRHAEKRMKRFFAGFRPVGEMRMALRIREAERPRMGRDVADQAFADPEAGAMHGRGIEALRGEEFEPLARAQHVDRAHFCDQVAGDDAHDFVEALLGGARPRHHVAQPFQHQPRAGKRRCPLHVRRLRPERATSALRAPGWSVPV